MVVIADTGRYGLTEESDQMYLGCANTSEFAGAPENVLWINQAEQDLRYDFDPEKRVTERSTNCRPQLG